MTTFDKLRPGTDSLENKIIPETGFDRFKVPDIQETIIPSVEPVVQEPITKVPEKKVQKVSKTSEDIDFFEGTFKKTFTTEFDPAESLGEKFTRQFIGVPLQAVASALQGLSEFGGLLVPDKLLEAGPTIPLELPSKLKPRPGLESASAFVEQLLVPGLGFTKAVKGASDLAKLAQNAARFKSTLKGLEGTGKKFEKGFRPSAFNKPLLETKVKGRRPGKKQKIRQPVEAISEKDNLIDIPKVFAGSTREILGTGAVGFAIADAAFFVNNEPNVAQIVKEIGELEGPLIDFLATDPNDVGARNVLKRTVEGLFLGGAINKTFRGLVGFMNYATRLKGEFLRATDPAIRLADKAFEGIDAGLQKPLTTIERVKDTVAKARLKTSRNAGIRAFLDFGARLQDIDVAVKGERLSSKGITKKAKAGKKAFTQSAYLELRLLANLPNAVETVLDFGGIKFSKDFGVLSIREDVPAFMEIFDGFKTRKDVENYTKYLITKRAVKIVDDSKGKTTLGEVLGTEKAAAQDIEALRADIALGDRSPIYQNALKAYQKVNNGALDFAVKTGILSTKTRKALQNANPIFIPFYRLQDEIQKGIQVRRPGTGNVLKKGRKGSDPELNLAIGDPVENMIRNLSSIIEAGFKNRFKQVLYSQIDELAIRDPELAAEFATKMTRKDLISQFKVSKTQAEEVINRKLPEDEKISLQNIDEDFLTFLNFDNLSRSKLHENVDIVLRDGKAEFYNITDTTGGLQTALINIGPKAPFLPGNRLMNFLRGLKKVQTFLVTRNPVFFAVKNPVRDTLAAFIQSPNGFKPGIDTATGTIKILRGTYGKFTQKKEYQEFLLNGGGFGSIYHGDVDAARAQMRRFYKKNVFNIIPENNVITTTKAFNKHFSNFVSAFEYGTRIREYERALANGLTAREAAFASREVATDFAMRGSNVVGRFLAQTTPFLNPQFQGVYRSVRAFREDLLKTTVKLGASVVTPSVMLWAVNNGNPDYKALPNYIKDLNWVLPIGHETVPDGSGGFRVLTKFALVPKPFDFGMVGTMIERFMDAIQEQRGERFADAFMRILSGSTISTSSIIPQFLKPPTELLLNTKIFKQTPIESEQLQAQGEDEFRFSPWTSTTMIELSDAIKDIPGLGKLSPVELETLILGYMGTIGSDYLLGTLDFFTELNKDYAPRPAKRLDQMPIIEKFYLGVPQRITQQGNDSLKMDVKRVTDSVRFIEQALMDEELHKKYLGVGDATDTPNQKLRQELQAIAPVLFDQFEALRFLNEKIVQVRRAKGIEGLTGTALRERKLELENQIIVAKRILVEEVIGRIKDELPEVSRPSKLDPFAQVPDTVSEGLTSGAKSAVEFSKSLFK